MKPPKMKYDDAKILRMLQAPFIWRSEIEEAARERGWTPEHGMTAKLYLTEVPPELHSVIS